MLAKVEGTVCRLCGKAITANSSDIFPWGFHDESLDAPLHSLPPAPARSVGNPRGSHAGDDSAREEEEEEGDETPLASAFPSAQQQRYELDERPSTAALRRRWVHQSCAKRKAEVAGRLLKPPGCKHWLRRGACAFGAACFFVHDPAVGEAVRRRLAEEAEGARKRAEARGRNRHGELLECREDAPRRGRRARVRNTHRASMLRRRLVAWFGREVLCSLGSAEGEAQHGGGARGVVLDIGGGKGELAFELTRLEHIPCCVIDPRPMRLHAYERRLQAGFYHRNRAFSADLPAPTVEAATAEGAPLLRHLRMLFQLPTPAALTAGSPAQPKALRDADTWRRACRRAARMVWDRKGLHEHEDEMGKAEGEVGRKTEPRRAKLSAEEKATQLQALQERRRRERQHWYAMQAGDCTAAALVEQRRAARKAKAVADLRDDDALVQGIAALFEDEAGTGSVEGGDDAGGRVEGTLDDSAEHDASLDGNCSERCGSAAAASEPVLPTNARRSSESSEDSDDCDGHCDCAHVAAFDADATDGASASKRGADSENENTSEDEEEDKEGDEEGAHSVGNLSWLADPSLRTRVTQVQTLEEARDIVSSVVALVGMHPDQGAEPLVDFALAHNLPFAVVPCCVYAGEASYRELNGKPVRSYLQFVDYLQAKAPDRIFREELDFEGRNICLYSFGHLRDKPSEHRVPVAP